MANEDLSQKDHYIGREQSLIKHRILQKYLERFALIIGWKWDVITYVDCFSGPWNVQAKDLADSSFAIALRELESAKILLGSKKRSIRLRCLFLEKDKDAFEKLRDFADNITVADVKTLNCELKDGIAEILKFVKDGGKKSFPFIFIDPTGWTGFAMDEIAPLLQMDPGEVLINFMTGHIKRFIESPKVETQESFRRLFGSGDFREKLDGLASDEREDAAVTQYSESVAKTGSFRFTSKAIILHPEKALTHFHLVYATKSNPTRLGHSGSGL